MFRVKMSVVVVLILCMCAVSVAIYDIRVAKVKLTYNSMYIFAYHRHVMGTFPTVSLRDCVYLCQNNDYCRTANYFDSNTGSMCSLFEEYSFVGRIVSVFLTMSTVISFDLCPPGFAEPAYICFGLPADTQSPVSVQQALNSLRFVQQLSLLTYNPIIVPPDLIYIPLYYQTTVQKFDWPSLKFITNAAVPLQTNDYDIDSLGNVFQTSSSSTIILFSGPSGNWSSPISYYSACLSDMYVAVLPDTGPILCVLNSTTGQQLFNYTMVSSDNWWPLIINHQLYVTSRSGLRRINLTQGVSASSILLVPSLGCKEMFVDASGRLYIEEYYYSTGNNSFVFDLDGTLIANYTSGSKLIVKASKYTYFVLNNRENPLQFYQYP